NPSNSSPLDENVSSPSQPIPTSTILTASATSLSSGQSVTFTASVTAPTAAGVPVDANNVLFLDNGVLFASEPLNASTGTAVLTTVLTPGPHNITAQYFGDVNFASSTSSPVPVTVTPPHGGGGATVGDITSVIQVTLVSITGGRRGGPVAETLS